MELLQQELSVIAKARRNSEEVEIVLLYSRKRYKLFWMWNTLLCRRGLYIEKKLNTRDVKWFKDRFNDGYFTAHKVEKVIVEEKKILVKNEITGEEFLDTYDKLVITSGARARELKYKDENNFLC